jgi:hypothetical protein
MAQGRTTKGGRLIVTNHRVLFRPRRFDRLFGARDLTVPRAAVAAIEIAPRTRGLFDGGLRRRLAIRLRDGTEHLFVVNRAAQLVTVLRSELVDSSG